MATFRQVKIDGQIEAYICKENSAIRIRLSRGSFSNNRVTGYNLYHNGKLVNWYLTLAECKEAVNDLLK